MTEFDTKILVPTFQRGPIGQNGCCFRSTKDPWNQLCSQKFVVLAGRMDSRHLPVQNMKKYSNLYQPPSTLLISNLHLLDITPQLCVSETKLPMDQKDIPKLVYFITYHSLTRMCPPEDIKPLSLWYPPRTLSDQMEFKKVAAELILKLQASNKIPRNFLIDKRILDDPVRVVDFLRWLTEFALRHDYLAKYGELIQVELTGDGGCQDINSYYPQSLENTVIGEDVYEVFETHIDMLKTQLLEKSTHQPFSVQFGFEELMNSVAYQQEVKAKLSKAPKEIFSENRELDRIQIMDKVSEIWRCLDVDVDRVDIGENQFLEGEKGWLQMDTQWEGWLRQVVSGLKGLGRSSQEEKIRNPNRLGDLKRMLGEIQGQVKGLQQFKSDICEVLRGG